MERQRYFSEIITMQVFTFPVWVSLLLCIALWGIFQTFFALFCQKLPAAWFGYSNWFFRAKAFEKEGKIYKSIFKIHRWKGLLPDGAAVTKSGYRKKHLTDLSSENLTLFLEQSCRAELGHLLAIPPFWVFGLFLPPISLPFMLLYALFINMPCVLAQRYNRPRIAKVLYRAEKKNEI